MNRRRFPIPYPSRLRGIHLNILSDFPGPAQQNDFLSSFRHLERVSNGEISAALKAPKLAEKFLNDFKLLGRTGIQSATPTDLSLSNWLAFRAGRRKYLHPKLNNQLAPLESTEAIEAVMAPILSGTTRTAFLESHVAGGKSSVCELLARRWIEAHPKADIRVLPLGPDYFGGEDWDARAVLSGMDSIFPEDAQGQNRLLIIEDAHAITWRKAKKESKEKADEEPEEDWRSVLPPLGADDVTVVITARSGEAADRVSQVFEYLSQRLGEMTERIQLTPKLTARALIASVIQDTTRQEDFEILFAQTAWSLVALAAALREYGEGKKGRAVSIELVYEAVNRELERVAQQYIQTGRDRYWVPDFKRSLLLCWLFGAMEVEFEADDFAELLGLEDSSTYLTQLVNSKEIYQIGSNNFRSTRHPAWGQLVMRAVDEAKSLRLSAQNLQNNVLKGLENLDLGERPKVLTSFLAALIFKDMLSLEKAGFIATGRYIHDEYAQAARAVLAYGATQNGQIKDRKAALKSLLGNTRRVYAEDPNHFQGLMAEAEAIVAEIVDLETDDGQIESIEDGGTLYQIAYFFTLKGDHERAGALFNLSKEIDRKKKRDKGVVMSGVREVFSYLFSKNFATAEEVYSQIEPYAMRLLELEVSEETDSLDKIRFHCNFLGLSLEKMIATRTLNGFDAVLADFTEYHERTAIYGGPEIYEARAELVCGDYRKAMKLAERAYASPFCAQYYERFTAAIRILGDAHLGLDEIETAKRRYHEIIPDETHYNAIEIAKASERIRMIEEGISAQDILSKAAF